MSKWNENNVKITFEALPENQSLARAIAAAYLMPQDPTVEELTEVKTAVSEAVSNAIIHGYKSKGSGQIIMELLQPAPDKLVVKITDYGAGIADIRQAMEPLFTTSETPELSGMGFTVMESFTDKVLVDSQLGRGTCVTLAKTLDRYYAR